MTRMIPKSLRLGDSNLIKPKISQTKLRTWKRRNKYVHRSQQCQNIQRQEVEIQEDFIITEVDTR